MPNGSLTMALPHAESTAIDELSRFYAFDEDGEARAFLRTRPHLVALLAEAVPHVYAAFGADAPITLAVEWDDEEGEPLMLFARIATDKRADDVIAALEHFDRTWFAEPLDRDVSAVTFTFQSMPRPARV
jgi:hypothetical protein